MSYLEMMGVAEHEFRLIFGRSRIEYDLNKEEINRAKHQYSLESAVLFLERVLMSPWSNRPHVVREVSQSREIRHEHLCTGDAGEVLFMVTTMRKNEVVRVISIRDASEDERKVFKQLTGYVPPQKNATE